MAAADPPSGMQWGGDRVLLAAANGSVYFAAGNALYSQERAEFLQAEFPSAGPRPGRAAWLQGLRPHEMPFCMAMAGEMSVIWPGVTSVCAFLDRFSHFYRNHRSRIGLAALELRYVAEGLLTLQHWPPLLNAVMEAMGDPARTCFPGGLAAADLGALTGRLLGGARHRGISLDGIAPCVRAMYQPPAPDAADCLRVPHYRRMLLKLERSAEAAAPLIGEIAAAL